MSTRLGLQTIGRETRTVRRALVRFGVLAQDAEDLAQEVVLAAALSLLAGRLVVEQGAEGLRRLRAYLGTIAQRSAAEHVRLSERGGAVVPPEVLDPGPWLSCGCSGARVTQGGEAHSGARRGGAH